MRIAEGAKVKTAVLVVDNVPESQEAASALLEAEGYEVSTVVDGETALETIAKRPPSAGLFRIRDPA
jgi:CheY-like chemotaxis protein